MLSSLVSAVIFLAGTAVPPGGELFLRGDAAQRAGRAAEAAELFAQCAGADPSLAPYARIRVAAARSLMGDTTGAVSLLREVSAGPAGPWARLAQYRLAGLLAPSGDRAGAGRLYAGVLALEPLPWFLEDGRWAATDNLLADPATAAGALPFLRDTVETTIFIEPRKRASRALLKLPDAAPRALGVWGLLRSGEMDEVKGILEKEPVFFKGPGGVDMPLSLLDQLLAGGGAPTPETAAQLRSLAAANREHPWMRVWLINTMRVSSAKKQQEKARLCCDVICETWPEGRDGGDALYWLAGRLRDAKNTVAAGELYGLLARRFPDHARAADALFALGAVAGEEKRWADALAAFTEVGRRQKDIRLAAEANYRCARIALATGDTAGERMYLERAAAAGPGYYHAHRALEMLRAAGHAGNAKTLPVAAAHPLLAYSDASALPAEYAPGEMPDDAGMARMAFFGMNGLEEGEWEAVDCIERAPSDAAAREAWCRALAGAGFMHTVNQFIRARGWGMEEGVPSPWRMRLEYPLAYWPLVRKMAGESRLDPFLLLAVARQESTFRSGISSRSGAVGVMQLMPSTAKWLEGKDPAVPKGHADHLSCPEHSLRLGAVYLRRMIDRSGGNLVFALASYNAGPGNCDKWRKSIPSGDLEAFVEAVPFAETRDYVKRVLANHAAYRTFYK